MFKKPFLKTHLWRYFLLVILGLITLAHFYSYHQTTAFAFLSLGGAFLILDAVTRSVFQFPQFVCSLSRTQKAVFIFCLLFAGISILIQWPGLISFDEFYTLDSLEHPFRVTGLSVTYTSLCESLRYITGAHFLISTFNFYLYGVLAALVISMMSLELRRPLSWLLVFILVCPFTICLSLFENRDSTFSLLFLILTFATLQWRYFTSSRFKISWIYLVGIGVLLGELRQDGRMLVVFIPFLLVLALGASWKKFAKFLAATAVASFLLYAVIPQMVQFSDFNPTYQATVFLSPLSYILKTDGIASLPADQKTDLQGYFNLQVLVDQYAPYDISQYVSGYQQKANLEDFHRFRTAALKVFASRPKLFFENRWDMFQRAFNFDKSTMLYADAMRSAPPDVVQMATSVGVSPPMFPTSWQVSQFKYLNRFAFGLPQPLHLIFATGLTPLLLLLFLVFTILRYPLIGAWSMILLLRTLIAFLLMPAGYFKYITPIWLGGWLLFLFFWDLMKKRKLD